MLKKIVGVLVGVATVAAVHAQTTFDPGAQLTTNQGKIDTIYQWAVGVIIGMALVVVGSRFFRKAK